MIQEIGTIGWAVAEMKSGTKVARSGWNGKDMYLVHMDGYKSVPANEMTAKKHDIEIGTLIDVSPYIAMKTADNTIVPWLCSQSDLLATDWEVA